MTSSDQPTEGRVQTARAVTCPTCERLVMSHSGFHDEHDDATGEASCGGSFAPTDEDEPVYPGGWTCVNCEHENEAGVLHCAWCRQSQGSIAPARLPSHNGASRIPGATPSTDAPEG